METKKMKMSKTLQHISWLALALFLFINMAHAQSDSLSYTEENSTDRIIDYLSPMEYAFMLHEETNWLLKANLLVTSENHYMNTFKLSLEKKIADGFSLNAAALYRASAFDADLWSYGMEFSIESRWYYAYRNKVRNKQAATHLSGVYLAVGGGYRYTAATFSSWNESSISSFVPLFAKWGLQRRFLNRGYVDFGFSVGTQLALSDRFSSMISLGTYVDAGLAFTRDKQKLDFTKLCPVLRCHAADRFLLKTNLVDIVSLGYVRKTFIGSVIPNISAEFKIGKSPFSINSKLQCGLQYSTSLNYDFDSYTLSPKLIVEGRYFYNLKSRILKGKTGNGLSANYVSLGGIFDGRYEFYHAGGMQVDQSTIFTGLIATTGIQRLISDHLYFDFNVGSGYGVECEEDESNNHKSNNNIWIFNLGVAIGYRF